MKSNDLSRLVASINHESTGYSPRISRAAQTDMPTPRRRRSKQRGADGRIKDKRPFALGCRRRRRIAWDLNRSEVMGRRAWRAQPNVVSINAEGLAALAERSKPDALIEKLTAKRPELWSASTCKKVAWQPASSSGTWAASVCVRWHRTRRVAIRALLQSRNQQQSGQLSYSRRLPNRSTYNATEKRSEWSMPSQLRVDWDRWRSYAKPKTDRTCDLVPIRRSGIRPLGGRTTGQHRRELLAAVDWRSLGIPSEHQWQNVLALIDAIGDGRRAGFLGLSRKLKTSVHTVENILAWLARRA